MITSTSASDLQVLYVNHIHIVTSTLDYVRRPHQHQQVIFKYLSNEQASWCVFSATEVFSLLKNYVFSARAVFSLLKNYTKESHTHISHTHMYTHKHPRSLQSTKSHTYIHTHTHTHIHTQAPVQRLVYPRITLHVTHYWYTHRDMTHV